MQDKSKKAYSTPKLVTHGNVETLTQTKGHKPPKGGGHHGGNHGGGSHVFHK